MRTWIAAIAVLAAAAAHAGPEQAQPLSALARMPVREVTLFKDGHALLLHQGAMPLSAGGHVAMDYLPAPVLGTFWVSTAAKGLKVTSVTATRRRVLAERTCLTQQELIEANPGADVVIEEKEARDGKPLEARIVGIPTRDAAELASLDPPFSPEKLPERAPAVLLKTAAGLTLMPFDRIKSLTFKAEPKRKVAQEEFRSLLTASVRGEGAAPATADMAMMYVQKGLRWIPSYKVTVDGKGFAVVKLQATLVNELIDLEDVTANLVVGVPTFAFKEMTDPMALQEQVARLGQYFQADAGTSQMLGNAIMSQARFGERPGGMGGAAAPAPEPEAAGQEQAEDLFVYTVKHISLKKGARMVAPIAEFTLKYRDIYTLEVPFAPPPEVRAGSSGGRDAEMALLLTSLKVAHKLRITNKSEYPLTTAPALVCLGDRVLAQGLMTYTAIGGDGDLDVTQAVDVRAKRTDKETARKSGALEWNGASYSRIDLSGSLTLDNFRSEAVDVEVTRFVLGHPDTVGAGGKSEMVNAFEESRATAAPHWWGWYGWPGWWSHVNGTGRFTWHVKVPARKSMELPYTWHYFWR